MKNVQTKTKQQDNDIVAKKTSNYQQQKEETGNEQRKKKGEEPKYNDSDQQGKDDKTYRTLEVPVQEQKGKLKRGEKRQYKFRTGSGGELRY